MPRLRKAAAASLFGVGWAAITVAGIVQEPVLQFGLVGVGGASLSLSHYLLHSSSETKVIQVHQSEEIPVPERIREQEAQTIEEIRNLEYE